MRSIGEFLKAGRLQRKYSIKQLSERTKIKPEYIVAIERQKWGGLPDYAVVSGFVRSIGRSLGLEDSKVLAMLRRDYPPRKLDDLPRKELPGGFSWGPRLTFLLGIGIVVVGVAVYLLVQYRGFSRPPNLEVVSPKEGQEIKTNEIKVVGVSDGDASVIVNNQPVVVDDGGNFVVDIKVVEGEQEIIVRAVSRSGKETEIRRSIKVNFDE